MFNFFHPECPKPYSFSQEDNRCVLDCNEHECKEPNEVYSSCRSFCMEQGCNKDPNRACTNMCDSGCFCKEGFVRDEIDQWNNRRDNAKCVKKHQCTKCPKNEVAREGNSICEETCSTINQKCTVVSKKDDC